MKQFWVGLVTAFFLFLSGLNNGNAKMTSTFVRSEWPSTDIPLDNQAFAVPKGRNAPQQVHITQGDYEGKAVIISWVTPDEPGSLKVQYGKSEKKYDLTAEGTVSNYSFYKYKSGYIHECLLDGLETLQHYMQSGADAVLFVGDLSYSDRYQYNDVGIRWDTWGRFVEQSTAYQPWMWSAGNHEIEFMPYMLPKAPILFGTQSNVHLLTSLCSPAIHLLEELKKVDREKTPWLIVLMHAPIYNSNEAHFMEGESMRAAFETWFVQYRVDVIFAGHVHAYERSYRISNIQYNVTSGDRYPIPDKSAPVYITVGDGGNQEGLAGRFLEPQPDYSAFREASYGHSMLEIKNRTHALYHWNRNDDGKKVPTDAFVLHNQYWGGNLRRRKLNKHHLRRTIQPITDKFLLDSE
ncbi:unnamed protein product [Linum tenue]|uniref:Purple acid phosphatase n=1 Tax=Linum tenue TaxID=586396 RepID=A0AAV0HTJ6_9ROSI|nr:unnamed protein product [Linum tenue]